MKHKHSSAKSKALEEIKTDSGAPGKASKKFEKKAEYEEKHECKKCGKNHTGECHSYGKGGGSPER